MIEWLFIAIVVIGLVVFIGASECVLIKLFERFEAFVAAIVWKRRRPQREDADSGKLDSDDGDSR